MWVVEVEEKGGTRERRNAPGVGIKVLYFLPEILKGKRRKQKKSWDFYFSVNSFFTFLFLLLYFQFIRLSFLFKWGCYTILEIKKDSQTKGILRRDRWYRLNQASKKKSRNISTTFPVLRKTNIRESSLRITKWVLTFFFFTLSSGFDKLR